MHVSLFAALNEVVKMKDSEVCDVSELLGIPAAVSNTEEGRGVESLFQN